MGIDWKQFFHIKNDSVSADITMQYCAPYHKWILKLSGTNIFLFDFWNCGTVLRMFKHLREQRIMKYRITVEFLGYDKDKEV